MRLPEGTRECARSGPSRRYLHKQGYILLGQLLCFGARVVGEETEMDIRDEVVSQSCGETRRGEQEMGDSLKMPRQQTPDTKKTSG